MAKRTNWSSFAQSLSGEQSYAIHWPPRTRDGRRYLRGVENRSDATALGPADLTDAQNVYFRGGAVTRRGGIATWLSTALATPARSFGFAINGASKALLAFTNSTAYSISSTQNQAATNTVAGFTVDAEVSSFMYLGYLYCVNGTDFRRYDVVANSWSAVTNGGGAGNDFVNAIKSKQITGSHDRLVAAGNPDQGHIVYVSDVSDPTIWLSSNQISCDSGDGTSITTIENFDDWIVVGKPYSLFTFQPALIGTASFQLYKVSDAFGMPSANTAQVWAGGVMIFQAQDGHVYGLYRNNLSKEFIRPTLLSQRIDATIEGISKASLSTAWAVIHNGFYKLNVDGKELWLDLLNSDLRDGEKCVWAPMKWTNKDQPVRFVRPDDRTMWAGGATSDGQIYQHDNEDTDSGSQIAWYANSYWFDAGKPEMFKLLERWFVYAKAQVSSAPVIQVRIDIDQTTTTYSVTITGTAGFILGTSKLGTGLLGLANELANYANSGGGTSRRFRVRFLSQTDNGPVQIRGVSLYFVDISSA